jgi:hypothetical protein
MGGVPVVSGKVFATSEFERRKNVAAGFSVKNRVALESRRPRLLYLKNRGRLCHIFSSPRVAKIGHESLACASTGWKPVPPKFFSIQKTGGDITRFSGPKKFGGAVPTLITN